MPTTHFSISIFRFMIF